jgi:peptidoglycan/LPS O-acetylase OafA/YrhL
VLSSRSTITVAATTYRPDIDGLRCVAVLSVLAFHAFADWLPGGFVGVDIFFVISGYLISGIVLKDLAADRFTFWSFYRRRIRRILPALLFMLLTCGVAGWYLLFDEEFKKLAGYALAGILSVANIRSYLEGGYFATAADLTPLLHLWSLGVEEQFYLVWPLVLLLTRGRPWRTLTVLLSIIVLSFALNVARVERAATEVFYLPFTRMWELGLGALLAWWEAFGPPRSVPRVARHVASLFGAVLLAASLWIIDRDKAFPGWWAALPTFGCALVIAGGADAWLNRTLLSRPIITGVGLISYPLYLWHWPLLSLARTISPQEISGLLKVSLLSVSLLLAWLTYRFVELPIRRRPGGNASAYWLLAGSACLVSLSALGHLQRLKPRDRGQMRLVRAGRAKDADARAAMRLRGCGSLVASTSPIKEYCMLTGDGAPAPAVVLWGDSHALMWSPVLFSLSQKLHLRLIVISHPGCAPLRRTRRSDPAPYYCDRLEMADEVLAAIAELHPVHVFLAARWSLYSEGARVRGRLQDHLYFLTQEATGVADRASSRAAMRAQLVPTVQALRRLAQITILRGTPTLGLWAEQGAERDPQGFEPTLAEHRATNAFADELINEASGAVTDDVSSFDPAPRLCGAKCNSMRDELLLYTDDNHLTAQAVLLFSDQLQSFLPGRPY